MHGHVISLGELSDADLDYLVRRGAWFAGQESVGYRPLAGRVVGGFFRVTSTRTRTAFAAAALRLGAGHIAYGPGDLQLNTGESIEDTTAVLAGMVDVLVVRSAGDPRELTVLARQREMAVVNAMSANEHPTQALADLTTLFRRFGRIDGLRVLYLGEWNSTAQALAFALPRYPGVELCLATPPGYGATPGSMATATRLGAGRGAVWETHDPSDVPDRCDVVYTTRWQTTGTTKPDPDWRSVFQPFQVNAALMALHPTAVFMHDLPAHRGEDVTAEVLDGPASIVFNQAENKMSSAMAVLEWCLLGTMT